MIQSFPIYLYSDLVASVVSIILGCCFLFISVPNIPSLANYKRTRVFLAAAYFILGIGNIFTIIAQFTGIAINAMELFPVILSIAALQAFLFSYTLITLLNPEFITKKRIRKELILITFFILLSSSVSYTSNRTLFLIFNISFFCFYLFRLYSYTHTFFREYRNMKNQLNSFYSGNEEKQLDWLRKAFLSALGIGILIGICLLFLNDLYLMFTISLYCIFYVYFAIKYMNYPQMFLSLEASLISDTTPVEEFSATAIPYHQLSEKLSEWEKNKKFTISGITISELANELNTNRTYLSSYINSSKNMNFNTWVNTLRIEEAQRLMKQHPEWTIARISDETGFTDSSSFGKQFKKITGVTPRTARVNYNNGNSDNALSES